MPILFEAQKPSSKKKPGSVRNHKNGRKKMRPFSAFALRPDGVRFETQKKEEEVILFLRQHLIFLVPWFVVGFFLLIAPTIVFPFVLHILPEEVIIPTPYIIVLTLFWYVASFGLIFAHLLRWFFNIFILSDRRVIDIDFVNLLYKEFSEGEISRIQDISYQTKGLLATFFDYGDVFVQTAGEIPNFVFERVPHPREVVNILSGLLKQSKRGL